MQYVIVLRSALNALDFKANEHSPVITGHDRLNNYLNGLNLIKKTLTGGKSHEVLWVDNTLNETKSIPLKISSILDSEWKILTTGTNQYGKYNKGAGDIETILSIKNILLEYEHVFFFESRLLLKKYKRINKIIFSQKPFLTLENKSFIQWILRKNNKAIATGCYCLPSKVLIDFAQGVDLGLMVRDRVSIEESMYSYITTKTELPIRKWFWHSYRKIPFRKKLEKY